MILLFGRFAPMRRASLIAIGALLIPVLAACGSTPAAQIPTSAPAATSAPAQTAAPEATGAATEQSATSAPAETAAPAATAGAEQPTATTGQASRPGEGAANPADLASADQQVLRVRLVSEPASIDPTHDQDTTQETVIKQLFTGLMRMTPDLKPEGALADSWSFNEDNTQVTFKLKDTKWSDGQPVTAKDFAYAWQRFIDPRTASEYVSLVTGVIKGATELNTTPVSDTAKLQQAIGNLAIKALDDKTLQVNFEKPAPFFLDIAALGNMAPVRQDVVEKGGDKWTEPGSLIGNGPFILKAWTKGSDMTLAPNPNYYEGQPKLTTLNFKFIADDPTAFANYQSDEIDMSNTVPQAEIPGIRSNPQFQDQIARSSQLATYMLGFNTTKPPFNNQKVREAFSLAIDRKTLADQVLNGVPTPAYSFIPPGMPGHLTQEQAGDAAKAQTFDPATAKQLLADAGFPNGQGFPELKLAFNNNSANSLITQRVQADLQNNLGVKVTLDPREPKTYFNDIQKNTPDLFRTGWNADYPDPYDWDQLVFGTGSDQNYGHWTNDQFTQLLAQADKATDADTRIHYYQEAEQVLAQDVGAAFVYWYGNFTLVKPWVKGLTYTSQDPTPGAYSYKDAQILKH
jgi:oligopeptide transport system substrate-binding protein